MTRTTTAMRRTKSTSPMRGTLGRRASTFFHGVAHAMDLGGVLVARRGRFSQGFAGDTAALRGDWQRAMGSYSQTTTEPVNRRHREA